MGQFIKYFIAFCVVTFLLHEFQIVGFKYPRRVEGDALKEPVKVLEAFGREITLSDGRIFKVEHPLGRREKELLEANDWMVEVETLRGVESRLYTLDEPYRDGICGTPFAYFITLPLIPVDIPQKLKDVIAFGEVEPSKKEALKIDFKVRESENGVKNLYFQREKEWKQITDFVNPHHIYSWKLSDDCKLMLVNHMGFLPRKVSIYSFPEGKRISSFSPGVSGEFSWSKDKQIIHEYGFGTGHYICIYNIHGKVIYNEEESALFETGYFEINPTKEFIVRYANIARFPENYEIVRIRDGKVWRGKDKVACREELCNWVGDYLFEIKYSSEESKKLMSQTIDLSKYLKD